jgi:hypothetical protein
MTRRFQPITFTAAGICLLAVALAACGSTIAPQSAPGRSPSPSPAATTTSGFAGYKWTVTAISDGSPAVSVVMTLTCRRDGAFYFPPAQSSSPPPPSA